MGRSLCVYGGTGSYKTSQLKWFSRYIAKKTGKCTLLLSTDGGGWQACEREISAGMIRPYRCEANVLPLVLLRKISQGYWPENPDEIDPSRINLLPIDWSDVGAIAVEGWTSIANVVMRYLPDKGISVGGEDRNKPGSNMSFSVPIHIGGQVKMESFGSSTRGDYGFVQRLLYGLVTNFGSLPCEVAYSALEAKTEDEDRNTVYGPAIAGKKATAECGAWVGDLLHAQDYTVARTEKVPDPMDKSKLVEQTTMDTVVRYYFKKHLDPVTGIPFPAKTRVVPEGIAELNRRFPGGYFEPTTEWGIDRYLEACDELSVVAKDDPLRDWRKKMDEKVRGEPRAAAGAAAAAATKQ
jgi:hypothetical protein